MGEVKLPGFSYTFSWQIDACLSTLRSAKENSEIRANANLARCNCDCEDSSEYGYPGIVSCDLTLLPKSENLSSGFVVDFKCADELQRYEICFTYSIVNKEKECYVERSCPREAIRVRGCEARVELDDFLNRNVMVKDLAVEPLDTIEILCEVRTMRMGKSD
ncbi:hypothetical protein QAD02_009871 [Eretmocerus hayati]|uniref:Uncharacterized protein n=1 Tax=Eretmocerus hayati TaxID=131215 RepID=A0ACC2NBS4_9HYME|nr:hypothetical protein QAD02_009871 [Eretmocerus hayati]